MAKERNSEGAVTGAKEAVTHIKVPLEKRVPLMGSEPTGENRQKGHTARPPKHGSSTWGS